MDKFFYGWPPILRALSLVVIFVSFIIVAPSVNGFSPRSSQYIIAFPLEKQVVSPDFHIIIGDQYYTYFSKEKNQRWLNDIQLMNAYGDVVNIAATEGGIRPENQLLPGDYRILFSPEFGASVLRKFSVSSTVPTTTPSAPKNFHWDVKRYDTPWLHKIIGYVYDYIDVQLNTQSLKKHQSFLHYKVGFIPNEADLERHHHSWLKPTHLFNTKALTQTHGAPTLKRRWKVNGPINHCLGVTVYDGYGHKIGPFYQCKPRHYVLATEAEIWAEQTYEQWYWLEMPRYREGYVPFISP